MCQDSACELIDYSKDIDQPAKIDDSNKSESVVQDIVVIKDDSPSVSNVSKSTEPTEKDMLPKSSAHSMDLHVCVVLTSDTRKSSSPQVGASASQNILICELCGDHFANKSSYHAHLDKHAHTPYKCPKCGDMFYSRYCFNTSKTS